VFPRIDGIADLRLRNQSEREVSYKMFAFLFFLMNELWLTEYEEFCLTCGLEFLRQTVFF